MTLQARLDFEEDMPRLDTACAQERMLALDSRLGEALATARQGHLLRAGLQV